MSQKERYRHVVLTSVVEGKMSLVAASKKLGISYRQAKRIYKRYRTDGVAGLVHGNCGMPSHRAHSAEFKESVLKLYRDSYEGFGPVLACEKLLKRGYRLSDETLRVWLLEAGLWQKKRQRSPYRHRRERRASFGELLQLDGSHHRWFGQDLPASCLMNLVDDATGATLSLMAEQETTEAAFRLLKAWVERYGVPGAIYVDLKTVYVSPKRGHEGEEGAKMCEALTHFSRACDKLGIRIIKAYSPQAKGRVERNHAVYQDRLVKEMKLAGIKTLAGANALLANGFIDELNQKFAKEPRSDINAHRSVKDYGDLAQVFCWEYTRSVQQDWTFLFQGQHYQIAQMKPLRVRPRQPVVVRKHLEGSVTVWHKEHQLTAELITPQQTPQTPKEKKVYESSLRSHNARQNRAKTPWNLYNPGWLRVKTNEKNPFIQPQLK